MKSAIASMILVAAVGCGDDAAITDGGSDGDTGSGDADAGGSTVPPALPVLTPCPEGFVEAGEPARCEPFGGAPRASCDVHEAHFPSEAGCLPVGGACPAGQWADGLPSDSVRHVRAGAPAGGDGTMAAPFATITEALIGAPAGAVVAVAKGRYVESFYVPRDVTIWGACAAETELSIDTTSLAGEGVVTTGTTGGRLRGLTITGMRDGIVIRDDAELDLEGVVVRGATRTGITVFPGGSLTGREVLVRDTVVGADGRIGAGVIFGPGSSGSLTRLAALGCTSAAVSTYDATLVLEDSVLADGVAQPLDGYFGMGLDAFAASDVTILRSVIEGSKTFAVQVYEPMTIVRFEDSVVRDTASSERDGREGRGFFVFGGATLMLERVTVARNHEAAILVIDEGSRLEADHVVIEGTVGTEADGLGGSALAVQESASASLKHAWLSNNQGIAAVAFGSSALTLEDVTIRDTESEEVDGRFGVGLHAQSGGTVDGTRIAVVGNRQAGISAVQAGSRITLSEVVVSGTRERACAPDGCPGLGIGDGVISTDGASIALDGFEIRESARAGVHLAVGGTMDLSRGRVVTNAIGAVIQTADFDIARISDGVVYDDNGRNVDMSALPLPEPATGL